MSEALLSEAPPESRLTSCEEQEFALWSVDAKFKKNSLFEIFSKMLKEQ